MTLKYETEVLFKLMERDGFNIPSSVPPYEAEIKAYLINQVKQAYPKLTDYEAEWLLYNYTKHLPAEFPISSVSNETSATFKNVVPFAYQSAILSGSTKYRDIDTGEFLETFEEGRNLELLSVRMPVLTTTGKNLFNNGFTTVSNYDNQLYSRVNLNKIIGKNGNFTISIQEELNSKGKIWFNLYINGTEKFNLIVNGATTNKKYNFSLNEQNQVEFGLYYEGISKQQALEIIKNDFKIQVEEGSIVTEYEPYKSNILTVNEEVELRGIGDVKDTLDCLTGEVVERIGEIELANREWIKYESFLNPVYGTTIDNLFFDKDGNSMCDKLSRIPYDNRFNIEVGQYYTSADHIYVGYNMSDSEFKSYIDELSPKLQYQLKTPTIKTVELTTVNENGESVYFMPLEGTMNVQSSGEIIQPTFDVSVPVEATTQNLASFIDLEMEE